MGACRSRHSNKTQAWHSNKTQARHSNKTQACHPCRRELLAISSTSMTGISVTSGSTFYSVCSTAARSDTTSTRSFRTSTGAAALIKQQQGRWGLCDWQLGARDHVTKRGVFAGVQFGVFGVNIGELPQSTKTLQPQQRGIRN
jgi:hypothetical protein